MSKKVVYFEESNESNRYLHRSLLRSSVLATTTINWLSIHRLEFSNCPLDMHDRTREIFPSANEIPYHGYTCKSSKNNTCIVYNQQQISDGELLIDLGVTGIAVGMQKMTIAKAIQQTVIKLIAYPNFPSE